MRKLAAFSIAFSAAVFAANYILPTTWLIPAALVFGAAGICFALFFRRIPGLALISAFALCFGLLYFRGCAFLTTEKAAALDGHTVGLSARVLEYPQRGDGYIGVRIRIEDDDLPRLEMQVYDHRFVLDDLRPGQLVRLNAKLTAADKRYGEKTDTYNAKDIFLLASTVDDEIRIMDEEKGLYTAAAELGHRVCETVDSLFPSDTAPFMKSLMAGDRYDYNRSTLMRLSMSYSGFAHVVAVSGMHVAFLVGFLVLVMGKGPVSSLICIGLVWLFVPMTGSSPSAVRAGVMQTLLLLAPVVRRENDPITSLSAALALILLFNPYAAASISLQLSFGSMAGIVLFGERIFNGLMPNISNRKLKRFLHYFVGVTASSLAVLVFTAPLMAVHFGQMSLLSPLTNVLAMWAVSLCFAGGYLACALSVIPSAGRAAAQAVSLLARYILAVARSVASVHRGILYFEDPLAVLWLVLTCLLILWAVLAKHPRRFRGLIAAGLSALMLFFAMYVPALRYKKGEGTMAAISVGQGQCLAVLSGDQTVVIDCGATGSVKNAGETAASYLCSRGRYTVDALILTHFHNDHINGAEALMELVSVKKLIIPADAEYDEKTMKTLLSCAERNETEIEYVAEDSIYQWGNIRAQLFAPFTDGNANERCITADISVSGYDMIVTADISKKEERILAEKLVPGGAELLIVSHHGSKYSGNVDFLRSLGADIAIISVGYNTYGHPTQEILERLDECGYNVYRTDTDGTVEIRIR